MLCAGHAAGGQINLKPDDPTHPKVFMAILLEPEHSFENTTSYPVGKDGNRLFPPEFVKEHGLHP